MSVIEHITPPLADQSVCSAREAVAVLNAAADACLICPDDKPALADLKVRDMMDAVLPAEDEAVLNRLLSAGPAADVALDAIAPLFDPMDVVEIRRLNPAGGGSVSFHGRLGVPAERALLADAVRAGNGVQNIYFGANPRNANLLGTTRAASEADVATRRTVFMDLDNKDAPSSDPNWTLTIADLKALGPLLVAQTGNGWHVYFAVEQLEGVALSASSGPIAATLARIGSDSVADAPRIMRLPFTINLPTPAKRKRGAVPKLAVPDLLICPPTPQRPLADVCASLNGFAVRTGLPGRGGNATVSAPSRVAAGAVVKTGEPAPSADLLRMALSELPNHAGGPFDSRDKWVKICHAVKGASVAGSFEPAGRDAFITWSAQWGGDPDAAGQLWDSCGTPHVGWGTLMRSLESENPAGANRVKVAMAAAAFAGQAAQNIQALSAASIQPVRSFDPSKIPPRQWLYGTRVVRGYYSVLVSPGGTGKSALTMVEAVAMATGRELLPGEKPHHPLTVWYHNAEDSKNEQQARLAAVLMHYGIQHSDLGGRLILTSGRDEPIKLAQMGASGAEASPGTNDCIVGEVRRLGVDVLILDPIGAMHGLPENSNEAINLLAGVLRGIADEADIAIVLLHHTSKAAAGDMDAAGAAASRGASALTDGARNVCQMRRMTEKEARQWGISEADRRDYVQVSNGKANLFRAQDGHWVRMVSVNLGNGTPDYPAGDAIQTVERWLQPKAQPGTASELYRVQAAIAALPAPPQKDSQAERWVGWTIAAALELDVGEYQPKDAKPKMELTPDQVFNRARIKSLLSGWLKDGSLIEVDGRNADRRVVTCIGVGKPAFLLDETPSAPGE